MSYIKRDDCKDRVLYRISSRNLRFGVYHPNGFVGLRTKFNHTFPFVEYHWDNGPPFGTVQPQEELPERLPDDISLNPYLPGSYCGKCRVAVEYNGKDAWNHLAPVDCQKAEPRGRLNEALEKWLYEMEAKYDQKDGGG